MGYAVELLNGTLHCGFWHYPISGAGRDEPAPKSADPKGAEGWPTSSPLNGKERPPLVFETERAAAVAVEFYDALYEASHIDAAVKEVKAKATHRLTDEGFKAVPMGEGTLFG